MDNELVRNSAFMTHNGLKVRINHDFCLRNIREENITPWYTSIEAFDSLRGLLAIICTIIMMFMHEEPIYTGILIIASYLFGYLVSQSYSLMVLLNMVYGLLYMLYSILSKYFIQYIVLIVIAIIKKEYFLLLSYICARLICFIIMSTINALRGRYYFNKYGFYLGDVEITAIKILQFYSIKSKKFKQWINEYKGFLDSI
jgi:hypothetical protein